MFSQFITSISVLRMVRTGDKISWATHTTVKGHLKPLADEKQNIGLENMTNMYALTVSSIEDIREGDRITIGPDTYGVRGVNIHSGIRVSYMRLIITKEK